MKANLPYSDQEIREAFKSITQEGIIMNLSMILSKLRTDLRNPILVRNTIVTNISLQINILWLLQDYASSSTEEENALINGGVISRVVAIMSNINDYLKNQPN